MNTLNRILYAGLQDDMPAFLKRKVFPTNLASLLLMICVAVPFTIISAFYFQELIIYPGLGIVLCVGVIIANFNGGIYFSRVLLASLPIYLAAIYNAYLSNDGEQPLTSLYLAELAFSLVSFLVFDLREKTPLFLISLMCSLIIITFPITNNWFVSDMDSTVLRVGWISTLTIGLSIACAIGCILGLALLNKESEKESEELIKVMDEKAKHLESSEKILKTNIQRIEETQLEEKKRNWATEGIATISEILRANIESQEIYDKLTTGIVRYMKANQAGFYIIDEENKNITIRLASCYAYERKKFVTQEFRPKESGLLGQTYLEGEYIYLTEVPQGYMNITSGLGDSSPRALIIIPLKVNGIIEGILELASFNLLEPHEISFLEKAGEGIASFIQTNRINERTNILLKQTMNQAEEMRAQEEELRQNLEEMEAIQEEVTRKETEYIRQIDELKKAIELAQR